MAKLNLDALAFALTWGALAFVTGIWGNFYLGGGLALALPIVVMPLSGLILARTGDFALERKVRWAVLGAAAVGVAISLSL